MQAELVEITSSRDKHPLRDTFFKFYFKNQECGNIVADIHEGGINWKNWYQVIIAYRRIKKDGLKIVLSDLKLLDEPKNHPHKQVIDPKSKFTIELIVPHRIYTKHLDIPESYRRDIHD